MFYLIGLFFRDYTPKKRHIRQRIRKQIACFFLNQHISKEYITPRGETRCIFGKQPVGGASVDRHFGVKMP